MSFVASVSIVLGVRFSTLFPEGLQSSVCTAQGEQEIKQVFLADWLVGDDRPRGASPWLGRPIHYRFKEILRLPGQDINEFSATAERWLHYPYSESRYLQDWVVGLAVSGSSECVEQIPSLSDLSPELGEVREFLRERFGYTGSIDLMAIASLD